MRVLATTTVFVVAGLLQYDASAFTLTPRKTTTTTTLLWAADEVSLQERIQNLQRQEARQEAVQGRNWKLANWQVSGIVWNATVSKLLTTDDDDGEPLLMVGDEDGTVTCLQLIVSPSTGGGEGESVTISEDGTIDNQILNHWKTQGPVKAMTADDESFYTSNGSVIQQWERTETSACDPINSVVSPCHTLQAVEGNRLVSVDNRGVHIWSSDLKEAVGKFECEDDAFITCAVVDDEYVYLGMANGDVLVHSLESIVEARADGTSNYVCKWRATGDDTVGVTTLALGGETRLGMNKGLASVVFSGDAAGGVKQWFLIRQGDDRLQAWPKLSTQRLPKKSHLFAGHTGSVQALLPVDGVKFVSSSSDGSVKGWNAATGKELFSMEGFSLSVNSLAVFDGMLATNGMEEYLSINDFTVDNDGDDFDLEMPEYKN